MMHSRPFLIDHLCLSLRLTSCYIGIRPSIKYLSIPERLVSVTKCRQSVYLSYRHLECIDPCL
jgi:hypothetical protein